MITHFLGDEEVAAFGRDLCQRLLNLGEDFPTTWFVLGFSGQVFGEKTGDLLPPDIQRRLKLITVNANRESGEIKFAQPFDVTDGGKPVLLLDSAVHSGQSMLKVATALGEKGFTNIVTYSMVFKRNSDLVPNFFGVCLQENDRCLFQLDELPNGRLNHKAPFGTLRKMAAADIGRPFIVTGTPSIDSTTFSSLLYERTTRGGEVYVYERGREIFGVLAFWQRGPGLLIDLIANAERYRGQGIGGAMMRWSETYARSADCKFIELWAIEDRLSFYEHYNFEKQAGHEMTLDGDKFFLMRRKLLYNINLVDYWR